MNIVILTNDNYFSFKVLKPFLELKKSEIELVIFSNKKIGKTNTLHSIYWLFNNSGFRHTFFKISIYAFSRGMYILCKILPILNNKYSSYLWITRNNIPFLKTKNINNKLISEKIKNAQPDIIISVSMNQVVGEEILKIPRFGSINIHCAPLPRYRGMSPYIWILANSEKNSAATIHYMEKGLDEGDIIEQVLVPVLKKDTAFNLFSRCCNEASSILPKTIDNIFSKSLKTTIQDESKKSYYSWPDKDCVQRLRKNGFKLFKINDFFKEIF